jgi:hypothetical protein
MHIIVGIEVYLSHHTHLAVWRIVNHHLVVQKCVLQFSTENKGFFSPSAHLYFVCCNVIVL